jgi:hypothetical protein
VAEPEEIMVRIGKGIALRQQGDRNAARDLFTEVWRDIGDDGDPLHRCALAHSMADVQDDPADEVAWDLRALAAADLITDERARQAGVASPVAGFYPSLHLNLGEAYRKLGELGRAREQLLLGQASIGALPADDYAAMITEGLERLASRLDPAAPSETPAPSGTATSL